MKVIKSKDGKKLNKFISIFVTLAIIVGLIISGPVSAITLGITDVSDTTPNEETDMTFLAKIDLHTPDIIALQNVTVTISNNDTCTFDLDGNELTDCDNLAVRLVNKQVTWNPDTEGFGYGYGYLTGYGYDYHNVSFGYGYGYSYGYGYNTFTDSIKTGTASTDAELIYEITWTTPSVSSDTVYTIDMYAEADDGENDVRFMTKSSTTVTVQNVASPGGSSRRSSGGSTTPSDDDTTTSTIPVTLTISGDDFKKLQDNGLLKKLIQGQTLTINEVLEFMLTDFISPEKAGQSHTITIDEIHYSSDNSDESYIVVTFESTPKIVNLYEGKPLAIDLDDDDIYDIIATATDITADNVIVSIDEIKAEVAEQLAQGKTIDEIIKEEEKQEEVPTEKPTETPKKEPTKTPEVTKKASTWWIWVIIIVVILGIIAYFVFGNKKK